MEQGGEPVTDLPLTEELVARTRRPADGPLYDAGWTMLSDDDLDALAAEVTSGRPRPIPVFAYGSLIWNPGFAVVGQRRAIARGWHRSFSLGLDHWRGSPDCPGLMLAIESGGECEGMVLDIAPEDEAEALKTLLKRELVARELAANVCWISVETDRGREQALTFYADPVAPNVVHLPITEQAWRMAHACGPAGSCAEYLHRTHAALERHGIADPYIAELARLTAAEIAGWASDGAPIRDT